MDILNSFIDWGNGLLWGSVLIYLLVGAGLYFTVRTGAAQLRLLGHAWKAVLASRDSDSTADGGRGGITSFQAFATGLASRVGTGNIAGVAIAISLGGPGAVFWMWMTALLGMSTALLEASLAQAYKVPDADHGFRGGPAYYIRQGLGQGWMGSLFAVFLILAFGLVFNAVQSNSIVAALSGYGVGALPVGLVLALLTAPIIFGGIKRVSRVAEVVVPIMAVLYLLIAIYVILTNLGELPAMFSHIFQSAFGVQAAAGGVTGGIAAALLNGVKRGLFSNEAGMGSAPNAAAAASVNHPVQQGLVQMLGVFVDTIIICTATAAIILLSGVHLGDKDVTGVQLTQAALTEHVGAWGNDFLAVAIFLFAFTSIIGNYAYAESNVQYLSRNRTLLNVFRVLVLGMVVFGAVRDVPTVWNMADLSMGLMAVTNLIALLLLSPVALRLLHDYDRQRRAGTAEPVFDRHADAELDRRLPHEIWK
ncbi:alanine/glycine:cation symporter family protein [Deinococcus sp. Marseille-Q6407]|uniref:alanine/glycine:cation symporter family protein n=1 Tax=Deinococcus sp. Marseille-Q6407 TaxID=2969223 RepID=UPI0021C01879|nr:sodium:alanine symporter family protein [Deinococcus sp. Marseille-Q6407]